MQRFILFLLLHLPLCLGAQNIRPTDAQFEQSRRSSGFENNSTDSKTEKTDVPEGIYAWTVSPRFGSLQPVPLDTVPHGFQNENATDGPQGHYNYTGNLSAPRISRLFTE